MSDISITRCINVVQLVDNYNEGAFEKEITISKNSINGETYLHGLDDKGSLSLETLKSLLEDMQYIHER